jgi:ribosomal protein S18 acetylase RimI-like enzyme
LRKYPTELVSKVQPLPLEIMSGGFIRSDLAVMQGLDQDLAEQLVERSKEKAIVRNCKNDAVKRFGSIEAVAAWQSKGRLSLPLVHNLGGEALSLAGFGWMGPGKPGEDEPVIPGAETTFAIRIYEGFSGQGLSRPYTETILTAHDVLYGNHGVWLEAWGNNTPALKTYNDVGFVQVAEAPGLLDGEAVPRVYMTLGQLAV